MAKNVQYDDELSYRDNLANGWRPEERAPGTKKGNRKSRIRECYAAKGEETAAKMAKRLGIKLSTFKAWSADWRIVHPKAKRSERPVREIFEGKRPAKAKRKKATKRKSKAA